MDEREPDTARDRVWIAAAVLLVGVLAGGLALGLTAGDTGEESGSGDRAAEGASPEAPGALAIPADVASFPTLEGDSASLEDYRGRVVLLNLWGTWCPPCRREIPDLVELQDEMESEGVTVVGLAVDSGSPAEIRDFVEEFGVNYPVWYASGKRAMRHYEAMGYPTTLLIDREGVIRERYLGPQTAASLMEDVRPYLAD